MAHKLKDDARRPEDSPTAWFVVLERARQADDFEAAARARRELERLGVRVTYPRRGRRPARRAVPNGG